MSVNCNLREVRSVSREHYFLTGSFTVGANGAVVDPNCLGATITRVNNSTWLVKPREVAAQFCGGFCTYYDEDDTPTNILHTLVDLGDPTAVRLYYFTPNTLNDAQFAVGAKVHFTLSYRRVADKF